MCLRKYKYRLWSRRASLVGELRQSPSIPSLRTTDWICILHLHYTSISAARFCILARCLINKYIYICTPGSRVGSNTGLKLLIKKKRAPGAINDARGNAERLEDAKFWGEDKRASEARINKLLNWGLKFKRRNGQAREFHAAPVWQFLTFFINKERTLSLHLDRIQEMAHREEKQAGGGSTKSATDSTSKGHHIRRANSTN